MIMTELDIHVIRKQKAIDSVKKIVSRYQELIKIAQARQPPHSTKEEIDEMQGLDIEEVKASFEFELAMANITWILAEEE